MNKLYEALEVCLKEIEQGADIDTVLFRYPELAGELRPILDASVKAKGMAVPAPSNDVIKRNRAKLLQHASQMREQMLVPKPRRSWTVPLRRALVTLMVVALLFVSSTNLVRAASTTLPGDSLYPVKRTWEDVSLLFTFDTNKREELELEHENERLDEVHELFAEGRSADVDFAGYVTRQSGTEWRVSGITVLVSPQTGLPDQSVDVGAAVRVRGKIQTNMSVMADRIQLLPQGSKLPEVEDNELESEEEDDDEGMNLPLVENAGIQSEKESAKANETSQPVNESFSGSIASIESRFLIVDGISMDVAHAEIIGTLKVGVPVKVEGYYDSSGIFIVLKIEVQNSSVNSESQSTSNDDKNDDKSDDGHDDEHDETHSGYEHDTAHDH
jgi:hypothetical protein